MDDDLAGITLELAEARTAYQKAKVAFQLATDLYGADLEISNSDGITALRRANLLLGSAWDRYQGALLTLAKYRGRRDA